METVDFDLIIDASDHAELMLLMRRIEFLRFKANTEIWQSSGWRRRLENTYSDVSGGIGVKVPKQRD